MKNSIYCVGVGWVPISKAVLYMGPIYVNSDMRSMENENLALRREMREVKAALNKLTGHYKYDTTNSIS